MPSLIARRAVRAAALAACAVGVAASPAAAHVTLEQGEASANSTYKAVVKIPHGCKGEPTLTVRVAIPEHVIAVKPMPKPGWTIATRIESYAKAYDYFGRPLDRGVREIVWTGGSLPDEHYDEFTFQARLTAELVAGTAIHFPTVQECKSGKEQWIEIAATGTDAHKLKSPAPALRIVAPAAVAAETTVKAGALVIATPWTREPPAGSKVAGGYLKITNTGAEPDRLISGSVTFAKKLEVHEMAITDGVMRMRELDKGLEIKPGATVELKPGGFHLMFVELSERPRSGGSVKATLLFEKAGKVDVIFAVGQTGGAAPKDGGHHNH